MDFALIALLFLFGVAAYMAVALFASWGRRPPSLRPTETPPPGSPAFLRALAQVTQTAVDSDDDVRVLHNGSAFVPAILEAIAAAEKHVHVMVFIWNDGVLSDMLLTALEERARNGIEVRVLIDSLGGLRAPVAKLRRLEDAGARVEWFRRFTLGRLTSMHRRNHRRAIVLA